MRLTGFSRSFLGGVGALAAVAGLAACGGSSHQASSVASGSGFVPRGGDPTAPSAAAVNKAKSSARQLPSGVVATVAGQPITLAQYQQAYGTQAQAMSSGEIPLDPPSYGKCAAGMARMYSDLKLPKGSHVRTPPTPTHAQLVKQCQAREAGIKTSVMSQLIQQRWLADEAKARGVSVSDATVNAMLARQQKALGGAAAYDRYLARTGQTRQRMVGAMRLMLTEQALQQKRFGPPVQVSDQQVTAYFNAHQAEFKLPHQPNPKLSTYAPRIKLLLESQIRAKRSAGATTDFERRWRAQTICAASYVVPLCANAPH